MSEIQTPVVFSSKERAALVAKALGEAARRARFSTKRRRSIAGGGLRARRSDRILRLAMIATFVFIVAIPGLLYGVYESFIASPQYVAEARFTVRGGMPPTMDAIGNMTGAPSMLIIQDTQVIMNYMESRAIVEAMQRSIDLKSYFRDDHIDYFSRLKKDASIEKVLKYWKHHVDLKVQMPSGIVEFYVRAFTPADSVKIANTAIGLSEQLVNDINDQMRRDAVSLAETERTRAEASLAEARANLEKARNAEGMLSSEATSKGLQELMQQVQGQVIKLQQDYDSQRRFVRADAPQLRTLQSKIDAAKKEVVKLQARMTVTPAASGDAPAAGGDKVLSGSMSRLEYATLENQIREKIYAAALAGLERARLASDTKLMYINTFVQPVLPEESKYPNRILNIALVLGAALAIWGVVVGGLVLAKNTLT